jgi:sulfur carrier protein
MNAPVSDNAPVPNNPLGLRVNGEARPLGNGTLAAVLEAEAVNTPSAASPSISSGARGLAVAVNGQVVPRHAWDATRLSAGDEIEIVKPFAGG